MNLHMYVCTYAKINMYYKNTHTEKPPVFSKLFQRSRKVSSPVLEAEAVVPSHCKSW